MGKIVFLRTFSLTLKKDKIMSNEYSAGGEVVSWCTKCKLVLDHVIVALVDDLPKKVKCKTCKGNHNFRPEAPDPNKKVVSTARKTKRSDFDLHMSRLEGDFDISSAKKYSMKGNFKTDQVISHSNFGIGFILTVIDPKKVEILFKDGSKMLVQNR